MSAAVNPPLSDVAGNALKEADYQSLADRYITRDDADRAKIRRVNSVDGCQIIGQKGNYAGLLIPNILPGEGHVRDYRLRRDHPDFEQTASGLKVRQKYVSPPGRGNMLYFTPGTTSDYLRDIGIPIVLTEGEFKTIALQRLAWDAAGDTASVASFLAVGLTGVYSWRGTIGKATSAEGARVDVKGPIPDLNKIVWQDRRVVILFDQDAETNVSVHVARENLAAELHSRGAQCAYFRWPKNAPKGAKGIDDYLAAGGEEETIKAIREARTKKRKLSAVTDTAQSPDGWEAQILRSATGTPRHVLANAITVLRNDPALKGLLAYDEFRMRVVALRVPPWAQSVPSQWSDTEDIFLADYLQHQGVLVPPKVVGEAVQVVAQENGFHPVRTFLNGLAWDGKPRLDSWLMKFAGAQSADDSKQRYHEVVGSRFLISAIARIFQPGCKADCAPIFEAPQGAGKSTLVRMLGGEWYTDEIADLGSKDAAMQVSGVWFLELAELDSLNRSEVGRIKAFMSRSVDRFRPSYGRRVIEVPRQCIFAGTVNTDTYLRDETGGRRFWPIQCGAIDIAALQANRNQLFAEAVSRYRSGEPWWITEADVALTASREQRARYQEDAWTSVVENYCQANPAGVTIEQLLEFGLRLSPGSWTQAHKIRLAGCLTANHWARKQVRIGDVREWRYLPKTGDSLSPVRSCVTSSRSETGDAVNC